MTKKGVRRNIAKDMTQAAPSHGEGKGKRRKIMYQGKIIATEQSQQRDYGLVENGRDLGRVAGVRPEGMPMWPRYWQGISFWTFVPITLLKAAEP